jgi:hypothetical protein
MLSIFDDDDRPQQNSVPLSAARLQQLLGPRDATNSEAPASNAATLGRVISTGQPIESRVGGVQRAPLLSQTPAVPISRPSTREEPAVSAEFQRFSEQFTRSFLEAVGRAVSDIHGLVVEDRGKFQTAVDSLSTALRDLEALNARLTSLSQRVDSLTSAKQETFSRLGKAEEALSVASSVNESVQEMRQSLGKRLDAQADAIRTLRGSLEQRDGHLKNVFNVLQALQDESGDMFASKEALEDL